MAYLYMPAAYYDLSQDVTKEIMLAGRVYSAVPAVFLVFEFICFCFFS